MGRMYSKEVYQDVTEQVINMLANIMDGNGSESFIGWLEDGEVFALNGCSEEEVEERMALAREVNEFATELAFRLDKNTEEFRLD